MLACIGPAHAEIYAETRCELALILKAAVRRNIDQRQSGLLEQVPRLLASLPHDILVRSGAHGLPEQGGKVRLHKKWIAHQQRRPKPRTDVSDLVVGDSFQKSCLQNKDG